MFFSGLPLIFEEAGLLFSPSGQNRQNPSISAEDAVLAFFSEKFFQIHTNQVQRRNS